MMNLNTAGLNADTVAITDYRRTADNVARVVVAYTGNHDKQSLTAAVSSILQHQATPVENSFRQLRPGVMIGFVRAHTPVRVIEDKNELRASYKVMSSNIMMDNSDKTLWEVKKGAGGQTYLARHGNEDLSALIEASQHSGRPDVPRISQLSVQAAVRREFVAFASANGEMDYGFCVGYSEQAKALKVVSTTSRQPMIIPAETVASILPVGAAKIPAETHKRLIEAGISRQDANQEIEYYKKLYAYDPEYLSEVIDQVNGTASM